MKFRTRAWALALTLLASALPQTLRAEISPKYYTVQLSASVQSAPPQITLEWPADANATGYTVARKAPESSSWTTVATLPGSATSWADASIALGARYEYSVSKSSSLGVKGTGYVLSGIHVPLIENRGKMLLIVDKTHAGALAAELARLQSDLAGDGWSVIRHDVNRTDSVASVKNLIKTAWNADPENVKAAFLFGHVPVPYSGNFNPDGHPDHQGAWPADLYYGDMDGTWTDSTVNNTSGARAATRNVPGDGKFDQSDMPSDVEVAIGRVDMFNMTCFANKTPSRSELDLLRAYLNKHHDFRHGRIQVPRRGLICDNFGESWGEAFAASGWRNFAAFFGAEETHEVPGWSFFPTLKSDGYLWAYGCGGGSYYTCNGIGGSDDFALTDIQAVFTMFLGSYFGDWDNESNFLRAALGSGYTLATAWSGRPHWFFHRMGLGETIATSIILSQNNRRGGTYEHQTWGTRQVHAALLGDPTLRMHPVIPPSNLSASAVSGGVALAWTPSADSAIQGCIVYRASSPAGPFTRISGNSLLTTAGFFDGAGNSGQTYMVRAVKLEQSASGTYYNPSQGVFASVGSISAPETAPAPAPSAPSAGESSVLYLGADTASGGNWKGAFGAQGYMIPGDATDLPTWANVSFAGKSDHIWKYAATDPGSLQKASTSGRIASCWYSSGSFDVRLNITDGQPHKVTFYSLDWDRASRKQRIDVIDPASGAILDTVNISGFGSGIYHSWTVEGAVTFRFTRTGPYNAVAGGMFFDAESAPDDSESIPAAPDSPTEPTEPTNPSAATAERLEVDTTTLGNWKGAYGSEGYQIIQDTASLPSWAGVAPAGKSDWLWDSSLSHSSALQKADSSGRLAACWYSAGAFSVNVNLTDGKVHKVSFYCYDYDSGDKRSQRIDVLDAASGTLLDSVSVAAFSKGQYRSWNVRGNVTFKFVNTGPLNAVVNGVFIDPEEGGSTSPSAPDSTAASASFAGSDTATRGNWKGTYGASGYSIIQDAQNLPSWTSLEPAGKSDWIWRSSLSDPAALQKVNSADRLAACWYNPASFTFDLNLSDGQVHKVSLYCMDYGSKNERTQRIEVLDAASGAVIETVNLSTFTSGVYISWNIQGSVRFRVTNTGPINAVVSGIFID